MTAVLALILAAVLTGGLWWLAAVRRHLNVQTETSPRRPVCDNPSPTGPGALLGASGPRTRRGSVGDGTTSP